MESLSLMLGGLRSDNRAVTAVEYALMVGLVALGIVVGIQGLAGSMETTLNTLSAAL